MARDLDVVDVRRRVGMVFQKSNPFPKTIFDNVAYGLRINGLKDKRKIGEIVEKSLVDAALWDEVKDRLHEIGHGPVRRSAAAPVHRPGPGRPTGSHPHGRTGLGPGPDRHAEDRGPDSETEKDYTIVIVTHNMQQAARVSDITAFFYLGELIEVNETALLFTRPQLKQTEDYITGRFG